MGMVLTDAVTCVGSSSLLLRLPSLPAINLEEASRVPFFRDARKGLSVLRHVRLLRVITIGSCATVFFTGAVTISRWCSWLSRRSEVETQPPVSTTPARGRAPSWGSRCWQVSASGAVRLRSCWPLRVPATS